MKNSEYLIPLLSESNQIDNVLEIIKVLFDNGLLDENKVLSEKLFDVILKSNIEIAKKTQDLLMLIDRFYCENINLINLYSNKTNADLKIEYFISKMSLKELKKIEYFEPIKIKLLSDNNFLSVKYLVENGVNFKDTVKSNPFELLSSKELWDFFYTPEQYKKIKKETEYRYLDYINNLFNNNFQDVNSLSKIPDWELVEDELGRTLPLIMVDQIKTYNILSILNELKDLVPEKQFAKKDINGENLWFKLAKKSAFSINNINFSFMNWLINEIPVQNESNSIMLFALNNTPIKIKHDLIYKYKDNPEVLLINSQATRDYVNELAYYDIYLLSMVLDICENKQLVKIINPDIATEMIVKAIKILDNDRIKQEETNILVDIVLWCLQNGASSHDKFIKEVDCIEKENLSHLSTFTHNLYKKLNVIDTENSSGHRVFGLISEIIKINHNKGILKSLCENVDLNKKEKNITTKRL